MRFSEAKDNPPGVQSTLRDIKQDTKNADAKSQLSPLPENDKLNV